MMAFRAMRIKAKGEICLYSTFTTSPIVLDLILVPSSCLVLAFVDSGDGHQRTGLRCWEGHVEDSVVAQDIFPAAFGARYLFTNWESRIEMTQD